MVANALPCVYPGRADSTGVLLRAQGADDLLRSLHVWQMQSIYYPGAV